jgi:hypothetical protein
MQKRLSALYSQIMKIITNRYSVSVSLLVLVLYFLFGQNQAPIRKISPLDLHTHLGKTSLETIIIPGDGTPVLVHTVVAPDVAVTHRYLSLEETINWSRENNAESQDKLYRKLPFAFATELGIDLQVPPAPTKCTVKVKLDGQSSLPVTCDEIRAREKAFFKFDGIDFIPAGKHEIELFSDTSAILNGFATESLFWAEAFSGSMINGTDIIRDAWISGSFSYTAYFLLLFVFLIAIAYRTIRNQNVALLTLTAHAFLVILITPYFSGFDETAHVSNFYQAASSTARENKRPIIEESAYNKLASQNMFDAAFFRLNEVYPTNSDSCPHQIIGYCGLSPAPQILYKHYTDFLNYFHFNFEWLSPKFAIWMGRLSNSFFFLVTLMCCYFLLPGNKRAPFILSLSLAGCFFSQLGTLTNDIPMYVLGIVGFITFKSLISEIHITVKDCSALAIFSSFFVWARDFDVSFHAAIPIVLVNASIFLFKLLRSILRKRQTYNLNRINAVALPIIIFAFGITLPLIGYQILLKSQESIWFKNLLGSLSIDPNLFSRLNGVANFGWYGISVTISEHFRTIAGSYVWGHTFLPISMNIFVFLVWLTGCLILTFNGLTSLRIPEQRNLMPSIILNAFILILIAHIFIVCSIIHSNIEFYAKQSIIFSSFAQARLSAPSSMFVFLCANMSLFLYCSGKQKFYLSNCFVVLYNSVLLVHIYPNFFILSTY